MGSQSENSAGERTVVECVFISHKVSIFPSKVNVSLKVGIPHPG